MITLPKTALGAPLQPVPTPPTRSVYGRVRALFNRGCKSEKGTASIEFVICVPVIMMIFMAAMESGTFMTRLVMLERSVDEVMRTLRLGQVSNPTPAKLKDLICQNSLIMKDCNANITVDLRPVSTVTWAFPTTSPECVNRDENITPSTTFNPGAPQEVMIVRVCVIQEAIFPFAGLGLNLARDSRGGYALSTTTAFVNEP